MTNKNPYLFPICEELAVEGNEVITQSETSTMSDDLLEVFRDDEVDF